MEFKQLFGLCVMCVITLFYIALKTNVCWEKGNTEESLKVELEGKKLIVLFVNIFTMLCHQATISFFFFYPWNYAYMIVIILCNHYVIKTPCLCVIKGYIIEYL